MPPTRARSKHGALAMVTSHPGRGPPQPPLVLQQDVPQPPHLPMPPLSSCLQDRGWVPQAVGAVEPAGRVPRLPLERRLPRPGPLSLVSAPVEPPDSRPQPEHSVSRPLPDSLSCRQPFFSWLSVVRL